MAFRRDRKENLPDIVGLMDIIFLLLIFGMIVSATLISSEVEEIQRVEPRVLTIVLDRVTEGEITRSRVEINYDMTDSSLSYAADFPADPELFRLMRAGDYTQVRAFVEINRYLHRYCAIIGEEEDNQKFIKVKIDRETPFGIVGFLLDSCGPLIDSLEWVDISPQS